MLCGLNVYDIMFMLVGSGFGARRPPAVLWNPGAIQKKQQLHLASCHHIA